MPYFLLKSYEASIEKPPCINHSKSATSDEAALFLQKTKLIKLLGYFLA
jgi:hypothetical protein